ncbi:hypothetical protein HQ585_01195 [candidate division KSB1 bacterium]|nr:hypothetical protein [candidate division KSB1 bacterium]
MSRIHNKYFWVGSILIIGATSISAQVQFIREFMNIFYGNELAMGAVLAVWLIWTGLGSLLSNVLPQIKKPGRFLGLAQLGIAGIIPFTFILIRSARHWLGASPGEMLGLLPMLLSALLIFAPFCLLNGYLFPLATRILTHEKSTGPSAGRVYLLEAIGAGLGGLVVSLLLIRSVSAGTILLSISAFNLTSALSILLRKGWKTWLPAGLLSLIIVLVFGSRLNEFGDRILWKSQPVKNSVNSVYGILTLIVHPDQVSVFQNGLHYFSVPDQKTVESAVHYGLLQHASPRNILLIGGGFSGSALEALKHPSIERVDVIEPNRSIIQLMQPYVQMDDPRIQIISTDGRAYLSQTQTKYDAILLNLPNPYTAQLNRFYTKEFFAQVREKLNPEGIFSLQLSASENAIGPEMAQFLASIWATLRTTFPHTILIPGETVHIIASLDSSWLTTSPDVLSRRIKERKLETRYIQPYYLAYDLSQDRVNFLKERIETVKKPEINRDLKPVGFYFDTILWATYFSNPMKQVYIKLHTANPVWFFMCVGCCITILFYWIRTRHRAISFSILTVGFSEISLEFILILMFQIHFGHVYPQLAWIVAFYMGGLSLGAWMKQKLKSEEDAYPLFIKLQLGMLLFPVLLIGFFMWIAIWPILPALKTLATLLFLTAAFGAGWIGGAQFVLAARFQTSTDKYAEKVAGSLYGLDLLGSAAGALITSAILVPLAGIIESLICLSALNIISLLLLIVTGKHDSTN